MQVTFYSNFLNHHQLPVCLAFAGQLGAGFTFVATQPFDQAVVSQGYADMNEAYDFCLPSYQSEEAMEKALRLASESDVTIHGSAPELFLRQQMRMGKGLAFRYSERLFKPMNGAAQKLRDAAGQIKSNLAYHGAQQTQLYLLCAGAYTAQDYRSVGAFKSRAYKWGYFPTGSTKPIEKLAAEKRRDAPLLLWAGRMVGWKHGERALALAQHLQAQGLDYRLRLVGDGPMRKEWEALARTLGVAEKVTFAGAVPAEEVICEMEKANIFLFTSDGNEGWGAVLNEAMSAGCGVLADRAIGAAPYLIRDKENGLMYEGQQALLEHGSRLVQNPQEAAALGAAAKQTIEAEWNAAHAVDAFLQLCAYLEQHKTGSPVAAGPGSLA